MRLPFLFYALNINILYIFCAIQSAPVRTGRIVWVMDNTDTLSTDALFEKQQRRLIKQADILLGQFEDAESSAEHAEVGRSARAFFSVIKVVHAAHAPLKQADQTKKAEYDMDDDDTANQPRTAATLEAKQRELEHRIRRVIAGRHMAEVDWLARRGDARPDAPKLDVYTPQRAGPSIRSLA